MFGSKTQIFEKKTFQKTARAKLLKLKRFAWSHLIRKYLIYFGCKFRPRSQAAPEGPQLPKMFPRKKGKPSIFRMHCVFEREAEANKPYVWIRCSELIPRDLSVCRPNRLLENAKIYRRTSDLLLGNDNNDDDIKDYRRKITSSSSFFPPLLILFNEDPFLFY